MPGDGKVLGRRCGWRCGGGLLGIDFIREASWEAPGWFLMGIVSSREALCGWLREVLSGNHFH